MRFHVKFDRDEDRDSIAADQAVLPLTDEQKIELDRRLDAYETDNIKGCEVSEVVKALKDKT